MGPAHHLGRRLPRPGLRSGDRAAAQKLVDRALAACVARGIPACTTAYADDVGSRLDQGFKWLAVAADTGLFTNAVKQRLATVRK